MGMSKEDDAENVRVRYHALNETRLSEEEEEERRDGQTENALL